MNNIHYRIVPWLLIIAIFVLIPFNAIAEQTPFSVESKSALLMDYDTGTLLYEKNIHEKLPVASVVKIMTLLLTFEAIDGGVIKLEDKITISENAARMGGSQVFLAPGESISVAGILKAIIVASGNDASVAIAETLAGSEEVFVQRMNEKAKQLGMKNTNFTNSTGLPAENSYSTAHDVAIMSRELLKHPTFFKWSTIWLDNMEECANNTILSNTNRLVRFYDGADGIKTGSTNEAGYCLSATAKRGSLRLISVILNAPTTKVRFAEASKLLDHGFANYESITIVKKDQVIQKDISIVSGKINKINGIALDDFSLLIKKGESKDYEKNITITTPIKAPIKKGEKIGELILSQDGKTVGKVDITADQDVGTANIFDYFSKIFKSWMKKK